MVLRIKIKHNQSSCYQLSTSPPSSFYCELSILLYSGFTNLSQSVQCGFSIFKFLYSQASRCSKDINLLRSVKALMKLLQSSFLLQKSSIVNCMLLRGLNMSIIWQTMFSKVIYRLLSMQASLWFCYSQKNQSQQPVMMPLPSRSSILNQYSILCSVVLS